MFRLILPRRLLQAKAKPFFLKNTNASYLHGIFTPNLADCMSDKLLFRTVAGLTVFVVAVVFILSLKVVPVPNPIPSFVYSLPKLNAFINGTCSFLLLLSFYFIKQKNIAMHKRINLFTFALSSLFLVSYITYHWMSPETKFPKDNALYPLYIFILLTHIVLAAGVFPLILLSFYRGLNMDIPRHRKLVRWSFPIWLYVTVTGVIVYLMISPYYNFPQ